MLNSSFVPSAVPELLGGSQNLQSRSRDLGHAPFWPIFHFFRLVSLTITPHAKFEVCTFSHSRDIRGSQNLKVRHVTQATLPCDLILYFRISTSWSPVVLQISTWLDLLFWMMMMMVYDQNGRGLKRPQTNKAARQNGRMNRSFHLAVVDHLYTYRCHCCVLYNL